MWNGYGWIVEQRYEKHKMESPKTSCIVCIFPFYLIEMIRFQYSDSYLIEDMSTENTPKTAEGLLISSSNCFKNINILTSLKYCTLQDALLTQDFTHPTIEAATRSSQILTSCSRLWEHTSAPAPPRCNTIKQPHRPTAKGQNIHVTKDIQVLASANNSLLFSSKRTTGGDKTLPWSSRGHSPWQHHCLPAVVFTCAAPTQALFLLYLLLLGQDETATKTKRWKKRCSPLKSGFQAGLLWHWKKPIEMCVFFF